MEQVKKYRLGNQPEEYELSEKYLGWLPEGFRSWLDFYYEHILFTLREERPKTVTLVNPNSEEKVRLNLHQPLILDAFPMSFFPEAQAKEWFRFMKVSKEESPQEKFVIPAH